MSLPEGRIHIVGAGGAGMSAIAKLLLGKGHLLSGSDLRGGAALEALADLDVETFVGHHPDAVSGAELVVASSAVPDYDEELAAARELGVPVWRRPELLAAVTSEIPTIAATGTHGKTTTTAMLISALRNMGEDPSFIVGGDLVDVGTNGHWGSSDLLVLEADEAFRTFESLHLDGLVVTNVEHEHVDHFGSEEELMSSFVAVAGNVDGPVVACHDDRGSLAVAHEVGVRTYGFADSADWRVSDLNASAEGAAFHVSDGRRSTRVTMNQPGRHIVLNATGAVTLLAELGHKLDEAAAGVSTFRGVILYDDYAHHPTEVTAVLDAAANIADGRIWAVFQPHLYSRTERFSSEFGAALSRADIAVVTDVFGAREEPVPGVTGELVADAVRNSGGTVHYVPHRFELAPFLAPKVVEGDLVVSLGAGDITLLHSELAPMIEARS